MGERVGGGVIAEEQVVADVGVLRVELVVLRVLRRRQRLVLAPCSLTLGFALSFPLRRRIIALQSESQSTGKIMLKFKLGSEFLFNANELE